MPEHPNVEVVRRGLELVASGNADTDEVLALWGDNFSYYAFDGTGAPAEMTSPQELVDMMLMGRKTMSSHSYEVIDVHAVGEDLVLAQLRMRMTAAKTNATFEGDYLAIYRVQDGRIVSACDFLDAGAQRFMDDAWA